MVTTTFIIVFTVRATVAVHFDGDGMRGGGEAIPGRRDVR